MLSEAVDEYRRLWEESGNRYILHNGWVYSFENNNHSFIKESILEEWVGREAMLEMLEEPRSVKTVVAKTEEGDILFED